MTPEQEPSPGPAHHPVLTVAAVARRLGVAPSTLRTWDRRYGLGPSAHTAGSHRRYGPDDLRRLSVMRGLTLEGVPPAEAAQIALSAAAGDAPTRGPVEPPDVAAPVAVDLPDPVEPPRAAVQDPAPAHPQRFGDRLFDLLEALGTGGGTPPTTVRPFAVTSAEPGRGSAVWITGAPLPGTPGALGGGNPGVADPGVAGAVVADPGLAGSVLAEADALLAAPALLTPVGGSRAGGGRVLSLPDASPRARGLARAAMALDTFELIRLLRDAIGAYGVVGTWDSMIVPVLQGLGERWRATGEGVDVEHAFSEAVCSALRGVTATLRRPRNVAPVLLACADGDHHALPLHVVAAALAEEEVGCRMLGAGVPSAALVAAVRRTGPAVVLVYARLPVTDPTVLRELPRQRPAPRVLAGGPGWADVALPPAAARVGSLPEALDAVRSAV
jgi:MerR family transcriptional regulator, light-induced transcriptional regulator